MRALICFILLFLAPSLAAASDFAPEQRRAALETLAALIDRNYVYADKAAAIAAEIRGWTDDPALARAADRASFATLLSDRLRPHDRHFSIVWNDPAKPRPVTPGAPVNPAAALAQARRENFGFDAVERLDGNVGYLRISELANFNRNAETAPPARRAAAAAMALIEGTDAVIVDLRQCRGGSPNMVHYLFSHFLGEEPFLINRFYNREADRMVEFYSYDTIEGVRRPDVPLFVLTSGRTGSAAEEFAYDVKTHGRGVTIGETTGGAANPGRYFEAGDGFSIFISTGAAVNPVTGTNWEAVGVAPDIETPQARALEVAYAMALDAIASGPLGEAEKREALWSLDRIRAERDGAKISAKDARAFAGTYGEQKIVYENGALSLRFGSRPPVTLLPVGDDEFAASGTSRMRFRFQRDGAKPATALVIMQANGQNTTHPRS